MSIASSRTNGFLFADLRDYTKFVESHGDAAAGALLDRYRTLVRAAVGEFGGAEIKTEGDSFYVVFPSASSAVQCGLAILGAATERAGSDGAPLRVGIGVHAGETVETSEGYVGSAINVAARVCSQARAGELLVTDTVRALTRTFLPVRFVDRRQRRLKGIAEPVVLYRVEALAGTGIARPAVRRIRLPEPASGWRGIGRSLLLLAGLLLGGAAAGYLLVAAQRPPGGTDVVASPTGAAAATFPTSQELALVNSVPLRIRDSCRRTEEDGERLGNVAAVRCDLDVAEDADTVWYDRFATDQQLATAYDTIRLRERPPFSECSTTVSRAHGNWQIGSTHAGGLMCFQTDGGTWIVWTYRADRVLAQAVRSGTSPDDWTDLYAWWDQIRLFQR